MSTQVAPATMAKRKPRPAAGMKRSPFKASVYEAGAQTRRTVSWKAPTTSPNTNLWHLSTLRDRSRQAIRNDGWAKGAIDKLVTNILLARART